MVRLTASTIRRRRREGRPPPPPPASRWWVSPRPTAGGQAGFPATAGQEPTPEV